MNVTHLERPTDRHQQPRPIGAADLLEELQAMRQEQRALRKVLDEFCAVYLRSRFPYGKPTDRWARR